MYCLPSSTTSDSRFFLLYCHNMYMYVGEEREAGMSDSEGTLSAMSDEEQGASQQNGEVSKKNATFLTQRRRKKRLHSSPERSKNSSSKRGDVGTSGAPPGFSSTSERVNQEVAMKATRARKLLAKVRIGTV